MTNKNYLAIFAKSFNWAGFFLPKKIYEDCAKLYAFCRVLDNVADEGNNLDLKIERFNKIKSFYKNTYPLSNEEIRSLDENEMIINDMVALAKNNKIKRIILDDLIDGVPLI
tara:strand:- start:665 stop:1000 length:336 start_codon:yes stop_codon:yes gene_type:complete